MASKRAARNASKKAATKSAAKRKSKYVKTGRSSVNGRFVEASEVVAHPESTVVERKLRKAPNGATKVIDADLDPTA